MSEQLKQVVYTVLRVFAGTLLAAFLADITNLMNFAWADWKPVVIAAIAAALVVVINAINPKDTRYGFGKK
jgi:peptidoglycan biosynthesis protein MviN/MurJ (putative lipid II flippase)